MSQPMDRCSLQLVVAMVARALLGVERVRQPRAAVEARVLTVALAVNGRGQWSPQLARRCRLPVLGWLCRR